MKPPSAAILSVGAELLEGRLLDTNANQLAALLTDWGYDVQELVVVGDAAGPIAAAFVRLMQAHGLVVSTGGLGPTGDDLTRVGLAEALGVGLVADPAAAAEIEGFFARRGLEMSPSNLGQAMLPAGASAIPNPVGTAPGMLWRGQSTLVVCLPGPSAEWRPMLDRVAASLCGGEPAAAAISLYAVGLGESRLEWMLREIQLPAGVEYATYCSPGQVRVALRARELPPAEAAAALGQAEELVARHLGQHLLPPGSGDLGSALARRLLQGNLTLAVGESCTGGLVGHMLTALAGSSRYFRGGVVAYSDDVKRSALGVDAELLRRYGAVSAEVASAMARGVARVLGADLGLAITGIAGPGGGSAYKPVGTAYVACSCRKQEQVKPVRGGDDRAANKLLFARSALVLAYQLLTQAEG